MSSWRPRVIPVGWRGGLSLVPVFHLAPHRGSVSGGGILPLIHSSLCLLIPSLIILHIHWRGHCCLLIAIIPVIPVLVCSHPILLLFFFLNELMLLELVSLLRRGGQLLQAWGWREPVVLAILVLLLKRRLESFQSRGCLKPLLLLRKMITTSLTSHLYLRPKLLLVDAVLS